jgi:hypothetical protein
MSLLNKVANRIAGKRRFEAKRRQRRLVTNLDFTVFSNDC